MKTKWMHLFLTFSILLMLFVCMAHTSGEARKDKKSQEKTPIIVDTDMGFDDWMAILYLLNNANIEIKSFTVDCAGETYCPKGAANLTKLLVLAGKPDIPVFYGEEPPSTIPCQFPKVIRESAAKMAVPGFKDIEGTSNYKKYAAAHIETSVAQAGKDGAPLTIISIGSSTNIAQAIQRAKNHEEAGYFETFRKGIKMIYKGGGAVGKAKDGALTNTKIPGNLSIPGIYCSTNTTAAWNIFANAPAAGIIFTSGLPVTLIPVNLSDQVAITPESYKKLKKNARGKPAEFVVSDIENTVENEGGWEGAKLDYWDPSVVIAAVNPEFITEKYTHVRVCVNLNSGDQYATIYIDATSEVSSTQSTTKCEEISGHVGAIDVYTGIDGDKFYNEFSNTLNKQ